MIQPRDGDIILTKEYFIFYAFGYCHPNNRIICFLKYVPENYAGLFGVDFLDSVWHFRGVNLLRPRTLYSPEILSSLISTFRRHFPHYLLYSRDLERHIISVPTDHIAEIFTPDRCLHTVANKRERDWLEEKALKLVRILSKEARISTDFFGIHGSICLGMHNVHSDIDITVYGADNYRRVIESLAKLERKGEVDILRRNPVESLRGNTGLFRGTRFVVNAVRLFSEIKCEHYGCRPLGKVVTECRVADSSESVFRPAIYRVEELRLLYGPQEATGAAEVVSMIGAYRGIAREGDRLIVRGMLEECRDSGGRSLRIVVGSGLGEEYISLVLKY